jgi:beta-phosphoglucomutase-like phosphatase (HAD superfamily)
LDGIGRHWFTATVCGDEVEHPKPAPDPYRRAAALLGVDPADCAAIEDSDTGTTSALAAGCATLTVPCDAPVPDGPGRHFVASLTDVDRAALERLVAAHRDARA